MNKVSEIYITQGKVFAKASPDVLDMDFRLECSGTASPFSKYSGSELPFDRQRFFEMSPEDNPDYSLLLNKLDDWYVVGVNTAQINMKKRTQSSTFVIGAPVTIPAGFGEAVFKAEIASHRANADLYLSLRSAEKGTETVLSVPFDLLFSGGRDIDAYQKVRIALPASGQEMVASLHVEYRSTTDPDGAFDPFLFVARPRIVSGNSDELVVPVYIARPHVPGAIWFEARLPTSRFRQGETVVAAFGEVTIPVLAAKSLKVVMERNYGYLLEMRASEPCEFTAWINGVPAFPVSLGVQSKAVRIPQTYLTGDHILLQLYDLSGSQILWEDWLLSPRILTPLDVLQREGSKPFPTEMFVQSKDRFRGVRAHLAAGSGPEILGQLAMALDTLEAGYEKLKLHPLAFPEVSDPVVSVVIPAHNKVKVTYACLCALLLARNKATFEVILVDDASSDETAEIESIVSGITVIHNTEPQRFIRACNAGVEVARGTYVVLLNNDTEPTVGWLDELIAAFGRFNNVGLVGSKLLYPDGRLQDAGGIVWRSGNPWNYGSRQNPWEPRFSYARQVDYLSGAALMTKRTIWEEVGGLSSYLEPMYFEDTDLAFKIRDAGYTTWYVPSSVVYHYEGATSGTDTSTGFKRYQEVNRPKFKRRWSGAYAGFGKEGVSPDLEKDRGIVGRVLFIDYKAPTPDRDAGSYAALQEIRLVQSLGYKVTFLPENLAHMGNYITDLEKLGVEMIIAPFYHSLNDFLDKRGSEFDVVYVTRYHVANNVVQKIREVAPQTRIIMNNADLHFLRTLRAALAGDDAAGVELARKVRIEELEAMRKVDLVLSYNEVEHSVIQSHTDGAVKVMKCPWVVEYPETVPPRGGRAGLSFLGSFNHHPNVEGIEWFAHDVMSRLEIARPDILLSIYGSGMDERIRKLKSPVIDPVGFVEDVAEAYDRHLVFVAPLLSGAGIKGKVLSALAHGIPCVLSPFAAEGIGLRDGSECLIASAPEDWVRAITVLHDDADLWATLSGNGRSLARQRFSFAQGRELMRQAFEAVDLFCSTP